MKASKGFVNTPEIGCPDFQGQNDLRGQTMSMTGTTKLINVWKCVECGHSVEKI